MRLLRVHLRPHATRIGLVVVLQLVQTLATLYLPTRGADIIDNGVARGDSGYVLRTGAVMLAVTVVQILCTATAVYLSTKISMALGRDLRAAVFDKVQRLSVREVARFGAPSLVTRSTNDVHQVQILALTALTAIVIAPVMGIGGLAMALAQDVPLSMLLLAILPVLGGSLAVIIARTGPISRVMQRRIDRVNHVVREQITGIRVIRAFVRDERDRARFADANAELTATGLRLGRLMAVMKPTTMLIIDGSSVVVLWFAGYRIDEGAMQVGSLIAFLHYLLQILQAVLIATGAFLAAPRAVVSARRIRDVLRTESSLAVPVTPVTALPGRGRLDLLEVDVRYPGAEEPVLRGINLTARPGETTAIIGPTGAGKTTLLDLVPRLHDPTRGAVLVGGVDVREIAPTTLAAIVGYVPQQPYLFSGTISSNLRYGNPAASDAQLWHALEIAQAREFVEALPGRLEAPIGQGGRNVSGGQRQRLCIARTLVARPQIYLFDDCFSALDHATDAALRAALADVVDDATVVTVAQRVSTIRDADRIVVLDEGRIVGTGTHAELLAANPTYQEIAGSQFGAQDAA